MQRSIAAALLALCLGIIAFGSHPCLSQEQPVNRRKVVNSVIPTYPDLARRMQLRGVVRVQVVVASNGTVKSTKVVGGSPLLAKSAVDALGKWKWAPASDESQELIELNFHPE